MLIVDFWGCCGDDQPYLKSCRKGIEISYLNVGAKVQSIISLLGMDYFYTGFVSSYF